MQVTEKDYKFCPFCNSSQISIELRIPIWGGTVPEGTIAQPVFRIIYGTKGNV